MMRIHFKTFGDLNLGDILFHLVMGFAWPIGIFWYFLMWARTIPVVKDQKYKNRDVKDDNWPFN